jgi:hypothetical protein
VIANVITVIKFRLLLLQMERKCHHANYPDACAICDLPEHRWARYQKVVRSVLRGMDLPECADCTGIPPAHLRTWVKTLADGNHYKFVLPIRPQNMCKDPTDTDHVRRFYHYTNLQPLTNTDKSGKQRRPWSAQDDTAWQARTDDLRSCTTFELALARAQEMGINFGDQLWAWRNDPAAPRRPYDKQRKK